MITCKSIVCTSLLLITGCSSANSVQEKTQKDYSVLSADQTVNSDGGKHQAVLNPNVTSEFIGNAVSKLFSSSTIANTDIQQVTVADVAGETGIQTDNLTSNSAIWRVRLVGEMRWPFHSSGQQFSKPGAPQVANNDGPVGKSITAIISAEDGHVISCKMDFH